MEDIELAWERLVRENKESPIEAQHWLNTDLEGVKPPEARAYCRFELINGIIVTVPADQMKNIKSTQWGSDNGTITIYGGYS